MENANKKGLNADLIEHDLENCCRGEGLCGQCQGRECNIGFAKQCIRQYMRDPKKEVAVGTTQIPIIDVKSFEEEELELGIAHILKECKDCKEDHVEDCIINVIRNCYEVSLLGDLHPYEGTALQYLMYLREYCPEKAGHIAGIYKSLS